MDYNSRYFPIQFKSSYKGFDFSISQEFICGSMKDNTKSYYKNTLIVKEGNIIIYQDYWIGQLSKQYLDMMSRDLIDWLIDNPMFQNPNPSKCSHLIQGKSNHLQSNALRVETISIQNRCSNKYPDVYNSFNEDTIANLIMVDICNGYVLEYGICDVNSCPNYSPI